MADTLAPFAGASFTAADHGILITFWESWFGLLAYSLQIYYDFSGYSDMAVGLSRLLGVNIPINFQSPYQASSIIEFWRRWHISLSTFLRDYVYIPLGGNRRGASMRYVNLLVTMLLGGLWHGATWGFVVWGGLHGAYLLINHALRSRLNSSRVWLHIPILLRGVSGWCFTFIAVTLAWSFFRCASIAGAINIISGAAGLNGIGLPQSLSTEVFWLQNSIPWLEWRASGMMPNDLSEHKIAWMLWVAVSASIAWLAPNSNFIAGISNEQEYSKEPNRLVAVAAGLLFGLGLLSLQRNSPFLYFQF